MTRLIAEILEIPEPHFSHTIKSWEQASERAGHDVRLMTDIVHARRQAIKYLKLDENDTTAKELYYALRHEALKTNDGLQNRLGVKDTDTPEQVVDKVADFAEKLAMPKEVWVIKHSVVKGILKQQPPKKLLKALGLRSIDSVLKRNSAYELLAMAYKVESNEWTKKIHTKFKKLSPTEFADSKRCIYKINTEKADRLQKGGFQRANVTVPNYETGTILLVPPAHRFPADTLAILLALLQAMYDLRVYSSYFRYISVKSGFGQRLFQVLQEGLPGRHSQMQIGWKVLQRHFNYSPDSFAEFEQPYLQKEDVRLVAPLEILSPNMHNGRFWKQIHFVFVPEGRQAVSMHLMDVVTNTSNQLPFEQSDYSHLRRHLWEELGLRYLQSDRLRSRLIRDIE